MTITFGDTDYSGTSRSAERSTYHKLGMKDNQRTLVVRIAPAYGPREKTRQFSRYVKTHFGYKLRIGKDSDNKFVPFTFLCIEKKDSDGNIVEHCPKCDEMAEKRKKLESKVKAMTEAKASPEDIAASTKHLSEWLKDHNLDKKWYLVAKNQDGAWGFLQLNNSCYNLFWNTKDPKSPGLCQQLADKGFKPLSPDRGVWFRFTRTGQKFHEIVDIPSVEKEIVQVNGEALEKTKLDSLTQVDLDAIEKLPDLLSLGRALTYQQIRTLVDSGGDEGTIKSMAQSSSVKPRATPVPAVSTPVVVEPVEQDDIPEPPMNVPASVLVTTPPTPQTPVVEDEEAKLLAQLAALKAAKAAKAAPPTPEPVKAASLEADLSDEVTEFLRKFGK